MFVSALKFARVVTKVVARQRARGARHPIGNRWPTHNALQSLPLVWPYHAVLAVKDCARFACSRP